MAPWGNTITITNLPAGWDDPYAAYPGGNPIPIVPSPTMTFPQNAAYTTFPLDMPATNMDQWNVSYQHQLGSRWMVSANYVSSRGRRLPIGDHLNPAIFGPGATTANTNQRRVLSLQNPSQGQYYGSIIGIETTGTSVYDGLLLSAQHRATNGLTLSANYTLSRCTSDLVNYEPAQAGIPLTKPGDKAYDRGSCGVSDRRHIGNISTVYQVPKLSTGAVAALTRDWQVSGIVRAQTGNFYGVTTGADNALSGTPNQRPNLLSKKSRSTLSCPICW